MKKIIAKIKSKQGESFVEILIAILIVAFGCMLIATMYSSAMNLNIQASKQDDSYYSAVSEMEQIYDKGKKDKSDGHAVITEEEGEKKSYDVSVDIYGNDNNSAYKRR